MGERGDGRLCRFNFYYKGLCDGHNRIWKVVRSFV